MFRQPSTGEIDRLFAEHGPKSDWDGLRQKLERIDRRKLRGRELETWLHARGVVEFHAGNRPAALARFEQARQEFPGSSLIRFGLGQEYEFLGRSAEMAECFRRVRLEEVGGPYLMAAVRYLYLWGRLDEARAMVRQVLDAYHQLKVIDPHFLATRGLPMFSSAFGAFSALAVAAGQPEQAEEELERARKRLKEYRFEFDAAALAAEVRGERQPLLEWAAEQARETARLQGPTGLYSLLTAVHRARGEYRLGEARRLVDGVILTPRDLPWLEDLRLEFRAELAATAEDADEEERLVRELFGRQPLLFEPDHALHFGLVRYQERLKPRYRRTRGGGTQPE